MLKTGLVSISFRKLRTTEIIKMVREAGLDAIEWGGDFHVPHGDVMRAAEVAGACELSGIKCPSYGSYYRLGEYEEPRSEFKKVLASARTLKSEIIRVWAGTRPTKDADEAYWSVITDQLRMVCDMAGLEGIDIGLEFHANTLTDNSTDCLKLIARTNEPNLTTYWQPPVSRSHKDNLHDIRVMKQYISNVHTFTWQGRERLELEKGYDRWIEYFEALKTQRIRYCMLEFIKDDSTETFYKDAKTLRKMTAEANR